MFSRRSLVLSRIPLGTVGAGSVRILRVDALFVAAALVYLSSFGDALAASRVFWDDFESGTVAKWTKNGQRDLCSVVKRSVDNATPHGGAYMAECNWNGAVAWDDPASFSTLNLPSWPYAKEFMIRFWVRAASDNAHTYGAKFFRLYPANPNINQVIFDFQFDSQPNEGIMATWTVDSQTSVFWGGKVVLGGDAAWHKLELYIKENDAGAQNGVIRLWQDGVFRTEVLNLKTAALNMKWTGLFLMSNWTNNGPLWLHGANNHVEWDDIEIFSDVDSGDPVSGQLSDASVTITSQSPVVAPVSRVKPSPPSKVIVK